MTSVQSTRSSIVNRVSDWGSRDLNSNLCSAMGIHWEVALVKPSFKYPY